MKNKNKTIITIATCLLLAGGIGATAYFAGTKNGSSSTEKTEANNKTADSNKTGNKGNNGSSGNADQEDNTGATVADMALKITDKDRDTSYSGAESKLIKLTDDSGTVKITEEGTYVVTGSTSDGMLIIDVDKEEDVHLILKEATINSSTSAAIYVLSADEVYITLEGDNVLSNGGQYVAIDENDIDAVIFSKDDLTINGSGSLTIDTDANHAIVCKDDMVITGGNFDINAKVDAINTNDSLAITDGTFKISCGDDAIHTDGILQIDGGTFDITAAEGLEGTYITINDGTLVINASGDGINAGQKVQDYTPTVIINGGDITITMGAGDTDGIDSNGNIYINGGTTRISGQSTVDYDGVAEKNGGTLIINGEETDTIPNQFMGGFPNGQGGPGGNGGRGNMGQMPEGFDGQMPEGFDGQMPDGFDGQFPSGFDGQMPEGFDGQFPGGKPGDSSDDQQQGNKGRQGRRSGSTNNSDAESL
ncbi:MAG: carbohydrate-binding domain-containing protein [Clostridiales bacterium]|nr:carbohydrate-binding domain-containing protein [Clostridiales bacterium]